MTKENLIKIIGRNFKPKDVGIGVLNCISEKEQVENLANELLEAINYTRCCKSDSEQLFAVLRYAMPDQFSDIALKNIVKGFEEQSK